jgi:hypothetical protein
MQRTVVGFFVALSLAGGCTSKSPQSSSSAGGQIVSDIKVERTQPLDSEILEEWSRVTTEPDLLGVGASRIPLDDWPWQVHVSVMEFIRTEPLESELESAISAALSAVPGVKQAVHEDREQWAVKGNADGPSLVRAASAVVERYSSKTREVLRKLDSNK